MGRLEVYWLTAAEYGVPPGDEWLSHAEIAFLDSLRNPKRRADWRLGRWTAKLAIAAYYDRAHDFPALARIEAWPRASGAPEAFCGGRRAGVSISLSHSHGVALCAITPPDAALGCDIEQVTPHSRAFLADYFTGEEQKAVEFLPEIQRDRVLTLLWSAKESVLKLLQTGLRADTRSVGSNPAGVLASRRETWHPLIANDFAGRTFHGWWRESGEFMLTMAAVPRPSEPLALSTRLFPSREELGARS